MNGWPWLRTPDATRVIHRLWTEDQEHERQLKDAAEKQKAEREDLVTRYLRKL